MTGSSSSTMARRLAAGGAVVMLAALGWPQELPTRSPDCWRVTKLDGAPDLRWRMVIENDETCRQLPLLESPEGENLRIEVAGHAGSGDNPSCAIDLADCGCDVELKGVFRHRETAVAVLNAHSRWSGPQADELAATCLLAVRLNPVPEVLFERHLRTPGSSSCRGDQSYSITPTSNQLWITMRSSDGFLEWPVGERPAERSGLLDSTLRELADVVAGVPATLTRRLAPVTAVNGASWLLLAEPFTCPLRWVAIGRTRAGERPFSAELSYDGPSFSVQTEHGRDGDQSDPWPRDDWALADFRWSKGSVGSAPMGAAQAQLVAADGRRELYLLSWPCVHERWDAAADYEFPADEAWAVLLDGTDPESVKVRSQLVRTCLTFEALPASHGRGGMQRTFENGVLDSIVEGGRTVGLRVRFSRPRVFTDGANPNPLPDSREAMEKWYPDENWWRPLFDDFDPAREVELRVDR